MRRRSWVERSQGTRPANLGAAIKNQVLLNGSLWLMALNYFAISMVRAALADWAVQFLEESKGLPMSFAARCLFLMESGGFAGSLLAGAASDRLFQGRRGPVVCTCTALLAPSLLLLGVHQNLVTPRNGEVVVAATQDFLTGAYLLSRKNVFLTRDQFCRLCAYLSDANEHIELPPPASTLWPNG